MSVQLVYETHATTTDNERGIATGWLPGELSSTGIENAHELGARRRDDGIDVIVSSDLARAVQTVEVAFDGSPVPRVTDPRLREVDYGDLNGAPVDVIHPQRRDRVDRPFPGGQSYRDVSELVGSLLNDLRRDRDGQRVLLVGHAATRFALDHLLTARPLEDAVAGAFAWREGWEYILADELPKVAVLDGPAALAVVDEVGAVYRAAFTAPGYDETEDQARGFVDKTLSTHADRDGFRLVTLRLGAELVGFAYAYTGERGQWWPDRVAASVPRELADEWLGGHFEVVEMAVVPIMQRRGYGVALMDHLVAGIPHERALLTTYADDRPAPRLYARLGWERLAHGLLDGTHDLWGLRRGARA